MKRHILGPLVVAMAMGCAGEAAAGSIYLTGHDVLLHSGQNSYDNVILNYLRGAGTASEIPAGSYDILLLRGFSGSVGSIGITTLEGFGTITIRDIADFGGVGGAAALTTALTGNEVVVIPSHTSCGGCDLTTGDADILESLSAVFTAYFNAGGDIYANSGADDTSFYNFLPPSAVASGTSISGSSGFVATAAGLAILIQNNMINGFPTHNRFSSFDSDFTVFETRGVTGGDDEVISIGLRDARIIEDDGIVTDDGTDGDVPEPATMSLLALGLAAAYAGRRRKA